MTHLTKMVNGEEVPLTKEEIAEYNAREEAHNTWLNSDEYARQEFEKRNFDIIKQLADIDLKSIRALRANDTEHLAELEAQAASLRLQLT